MKEKIIVIGSGSWGTSIANLIAKNGYLTTLISRNDSIAQEINFNKSNNKYLPQINLNQNLIAKTNLNQEIIDCDYIFIAVPSNSFLELVDKIKSMNLKKNCGFVVLSKGLESKSLEFFHQIISKNFSKNSCAILSGPNFAIEVANEYPTITTIASQDKIFANKIIKILQNHYFKPEYSAKIISAEISAILKNIIAIACGIADGLGLGENGKSAILVKGVKEIEMLIKSLNEEFEIISAAAIGDIFLTCSSIKSRNNSLGVSLAKGKKYKDLSKEKTYEGAQNASTIYKLSKKLNLNLELCSLINEILENDLSQEQIKQKIINIL